MLLFENEVGNIADSYMYINAFNKPCSLVLSPQQTLAAHALTTDCIFSSDLFVYFFENIIIMVG